MSEFPKMIQFAFYTELYSAPLPPSLLLFLV